MVAARNTSGSIASRAAAQDHRIERIVGDRDQDQQLAALDAQCGERVKIAARHDPHDADE